MKEGSQVARSKIVEMQTGSLGGPGLPFACRLDHLGRGATPKAGNALEPAPILAINVHKALKGALVSKAAQVRLPHLQGHAWRGKERF